MEILGAALELDAVNELLSSVGEDPIENLDNCPPSARTALNVPRTTARDFQQETYWFNHEADYELKPDVTTEEITLSANILNAVSYEGNHIVRGNRLYNLETKSFKFKQPVKCEVTFHLPWAELPAVARRYITALSVEKFIESFPAAQGTTDARLRNLLHAKVAFEKTTIENGGYNLFSNYHVQRNLRRS